MQTPVRSRRRIAGVATRLLVACAAGSATQAMAQTPAPLAEWQFSAGIPLEKLFEEAIPDWEIRLGGAAMVRPRYDGSSEYIPIFGPSIDIRYRDLAFASIGEGLGINVLRGKNWRAGIALTYNLGRRAQEDSPHLDGMGNINIAPEAKLFAEYAISKEFPLVLRIDARRSLGGTDGWVGDIGAYMPLPGSSERFYWFAGPTMTLADSRYMNAWFGVSQSQARAGRPEFHASGGIKSYGFGVSAVWYFTKHWFATSDVAISQLVGDAASSPITRKATNGVFDFSINYEF
ncbi:MipA/OmpV family protein [Cupriavidus sp. IDO]|uniref:MipA/OmpV family protein n=1 Tax=Cupriavidus sp. IDO TaxID=1539142 RepID=UPI0005796EEF|nr:MipA/OmpV family protein [Cupriavidus sp. IDO]KWR90521.1 structural protein MipA [Cupriavidus sp. IDO]